MRLHRTLVSLVRDCRASSAVEFALMLPLMLLFLFGIIDVGLYGWQINRDEKATQMGARYAVVTNPAASGLTTERYVGKVVGGVTLTQGDRIPAAALGLITCNDTSCVCTTAPCPAALGYDAAAFDSIVGNMRRFDRRITAADVRVQYSGSGLGYAGDPGGMEIAPLTTVRLNGETANANDGLRFTSVTLATFGATIRLPSFAYTLTMEDGSGTRSN